jgi:hypothetical protein
MSAMYTRERGGGARVDQRMRGGQSSPAMVMDGVGVCGAAALIASSLAADSLGFWEGDVCGREGVL